MKFKSKKKYIILLTVYIVVNVLFGLVGGIQSFSGSNWEQLGRYVGFSSVGLKGNTGNLSDLTIFFLIVTSLIAICITNQLDLKSKQKETRVALLALFGNLFIASIVSAIAGGNIVMPVTLIVIVTLGLLMSAYVMKFKIREYGFGYSDVCDIMSKSEYDKFVKFLVKRKWIKPSDIRSEKVEDKSEV